MNTTIKQKVNDAIIKTYEQELGEIPIIDIAEMLINLAKDYSNNEIRYCKSEHIESDHLEIINNGLNTFAQMLA